MVDSGWIIFGMAALSVIMFAIGVLMAFDEKRNQALRLIQWKEAAEAWQGNCKAKALILQQLRITCRKRKDEVQHLNAALRRKNKALKALHAKLRETPRNPVGSGDQK